MEQLIMQNDVLSPVTECSRSMPKGWEIKKLGEVADYFIGLTYSPKDVSDKGIIVLRSSNVQNGVLDFADIIRVNKTIKEGLKVKEEMVDRAYNSGMIGFFKRWSDKKDFHRKMHEKN